MLRRWKISGNWLLAAETDTGDMADDIAMSAEWRKDGN